MNEDLRERFTKLLSDDESRRVNVTEDKLLEHIYGIMLSRKMEDITNSRRAAVNAVEVLKHNKCWNELENIIRTCMFANIYIFSSSAETNGHMDEALKHYRRIQSAFDNRPDKQHLIVEQYKEAMMDEIIYTATCNIISKTRASDEKLSNILYDQIYNYLKIFKEFNHKYNSESFIKIGFFIEDENHEDSVIHSQAGKVYDYLINAFGN